MNLGNPVPIGGPNTLNTPFGTGGATIGELIGNVLNGAIVIAGIFVLFLFFIGGFMLIQSAGSGDSDGAARGKQAITYAVIGFVIIISVYWIARVIELITGVNFITII